MLLVKLLRGNWANRIVLLRFIQVLPCEFGRRHTQANCNGSVHKSKRYILYIQIKTPNHKNSLHLALNGRLSLLTCLNKATQLLGELTQLRLQERVESGARFTGERLREALLGHQTVLGDDVDHHVPLSAVTCWVIQQESHQSAIDRLAPLGSLDNVIQEKVAPFNLWLQKKSMLYKKL